MFKSILSLVLLSFVVLLSNQSFGSTEPTLPVNIKSESDSTSVKNNHLLSEEQQPASVSTNADEAELDFWQQDEEVDEDSTSNSALSFNFIYYIIEKFKFQVE